MAYGMRIGIDEAMTRRDVSRWSHSHEAESRTTWMRFVDTLIQLRQRIADIREPVHLTAKRIFQIFICQNMELFQYTVHAAFVDRIETVRRSGHGREAYFVESKVVFQMPEDADDVADSRGQCHSSGDRPGLMILNESPGSRLNHIVAAGSVRENAKLVV